MLAQVSLSQSVPPKLAVTLANSVQCSSSPLVAKLLQASHAGLSVVLTNLPPHAPAAPTDLLNSNISPDACCMTQQCFQLGS